MESFQGRGEMEHVPTGDPRTDVDLAHEMAWTEDEQRVLQKNRVAAAAEMGLPVENLKQISQESSAEADRLGEERRQEILAARAKADELTTAMMMDPEFKMPKQEHMEKTRQRDSRNETSDVISEIYRRLADYNPDTKNWVPRKFKLFPRTNSEFVFDLKTDTTDDGNYWWFEPKQAPYEPDQQTNETGEDDSGN